MLVNATKEILEYRITALKNLDGCSFNIKWTVISAGTKSPAVKIVNVQRNEGSEAHEDMTTTKDMSAPWEILKDNQETK